MVIKVVPVPRHQGPPGALTCPITNPMSSIIQLPRNEITVFEDDVGVRDWIRELREVPDRGEREPPL